MQLSLLLVSLLGATALAKDHQGGGKNSTQAQCKRFLKGEKLVQVAANDTLLAEITHNNATKIEKIKAKAAEVQPMLDEAKKNTTLMATCDQIRAVEQENGECGFMMRMDKLQKLGANDTALAALTKNNQTKADKIKAKVQEGMAKLADLQKNTTLLEYCSVRTTKGECKEMKQLNKLVALSKNDTALNDKFKGNTTKIEKFKAKAAKKEAKLNEMMNNSTLMGICQQQKNGNNGNSGNKGGSTSNNGIDSGAAGVRTVGALSLAAVVSVVIGLVM